MLLLLLFGFVYSYFVLKYLNLGYEMNGGFWYKYVLVREYVSLSFLFRDI